MDNLKIKEICIERLECLQSEDLLKERDVKKLNFILREMINRLISNLNKNLGLNPEKYLNKINVLIEENIKNNIYEELNSVFKSPEYKKLFDIENEWHNNLKNCLTPEELIEINNKKEICLKKLDNILDKYCYVFDDDYDDDELLYEDSRCCGCKEKNIIEYEKLILKIEEVKHNVCENINLSDYDNIIEFVTEYNDLKIIEELEGFFSSEEYKYLIDIEKKTWYYQFNEILRLLKIVLKEISNKDLDILYTDMTLLSCYLKENIKKIDFKIILISINKILENKEWIITEDYHKLMEKLKEVKLNILNIKENKNINDFYKN